MTDWRHARTARLHLDVAAAGDEDDLFAIHSDPASWTHFPVGRHTDRTQTPEMVTLSERGFAVNGLGYWSIREVADGPVIGWGGCSAPTGRPWWNLAYRFAQSVLRRGYATEVAARSIEAAHDVAPDRPVLAYLLEHNVAVPPYGGEGGAAARLARPGPAQPRPRRDPAGLPRSRPRRRGATGHRGPRRRDHHLRGVRRGSPVGVICGLTSPDGHGLDEQGDPRRGAARPGPTRRCPGLGLRRRPRRATDLGRAWRNLRDQLRHHHEQEDTILFPVMVHLGIEPALVEALEAEHQAMAGRSARSTRRWARTPPAPPLPTPPTRPTPYAAANGWSTSTSRTRRVSSSRWCATTSRAPEWKAAMRQLRKQPPRRAGWFFAWVEDGASPEAQHFLGAEVPAPVRFVFGRVFGRGYHRNIAPVWA